MVSYPGALDALTNPASTDLLTSPGHASQHANINDIAEALERQAGTRGTSFPGSPTAEDRFWYETLNEEFEWNGSLWLSTVNRHLVIPYADSNSPSSATAAGSHRAGFPYAGTLDLRLGTLYSSFHVSGGTALSGSHKWVCVLTRQGSGTVVATVNIDSGASSVWRQSIIAIDATVAAGDYEFEFTCTKTGTPGNLYFLPSLTYKLVFS